MHAIPIFFNLQHSVMISYEILIPAYNAEARIRQLLLQLKTLEIPPERIILVDDGSSDCTPDIASEFDIRMYRLIHNQGKGVALKTGYTIFLKESHADYLLCMDADLQHPVSSVADFLNRATYHHSMFVIGKRVRRPGTMPLHRIVSNTLTSKILGYLSDQNIEDSQCGYRLIHRRVLDAVHTRLNETGFQMESEFILRAAQNGFKVEFVTIPTIYNKEGTAIRNVSDTFKFIRFVIRNLDEKR
jgi:glycosyltransferase involved in cell wall biosynthesis